MRLRFTRMHGCGNDYVHLDGIRDRLPPPRSWPALARRLADRHAGVGGDGIIILLPSRTADVRMAMFNADGSESGMCGNGVRCLAKLAVDHGHHRGDAIAVETGAGRRDIVLRRRRGAVVAARVRMGLPLLAPAGVPVRHPGPGPLLPLAARAAGRSLRLWAVGMGNPHAVCFVPDPDRFPVGEAGPRLEHDRRFPARTNVEFVARLPDEGGWPVLRQRTWERGSGETMACGTGACAATVAAILTRRIPGRRAIVRLRGGDLRIAWPAADAEVEMEGPAETICEGVVEV